MFPVSTLVVYRPIGRQQECREIWNELLLLQPMRNGSGVSQMRMA